MRRLLWIALASCSSSDAPLEDAKLETLAYQVPSGWNSQQRSGSPRAMVEWRPTGDNHRKESLIISRVESPALALEKARPRLEHQLVTANAQLPGGSFGSPRAFRTRTGLLGLRVEGSFTPPDQATSYHRTHAVLVEGTALVHVLYTARDPDRESIDAVLDGFTPGA